MKAFIYRVDEETNKEIIPGTVTPEYKSYTTLKRYYLDRKLKPGRYQVHCYYHWDWRYKAEHDITRLYIKEA